MTAKNKTPVRLYLDSKSVELLNEWAKEGDRSISQVVRDLIEDQAKAIQIREENSFKTRFRGGAGFEPKPMDFEIDPELEKSLLNAPVLVTHEMMADFKMKTDRQKSPIVSFPGGDSKVP